MTRQLHAELARLSGLFYTGALSDEEWALLQVHLSYCDSCLRKFEAEGPERLLAGQQAET
jgi:hypothetical protein